MRFSELYEQIGPHNQKEIKLLLSGQKPVALFSVDKKKQISIADEYVKNGVLVRFQTDYPDSSKNVFVYAKPENRELAVELIQIYKNRGQDNTFSKEQHAKIGKLLGYSEDDIAEFLKTISDE